MGLVLIVFAGLASFIGVCLFVLGSLGLSSYRLRQRLPVRSPVDLMHWGSILFSVGFFLIVLIQLISGLIE